MWRWSGRDGWLSIYFFFSSRRRHTRFKCDWSSDVCSSDLCTIDLVQRNTEVSIPFLFSNRGYGFLWHNPGIGRVELGYNGTRWVAEATPQLDYWITAGATPAEIMDHYTDATGHPSAFPDWAAGFWQCQLRYRTQDELLSVAREYKRRGLPPSLLVTPFFQWTP